MNPEDKTKLLELIKKALYDGGIGYMNNYPEDDCEVRRDYSCLHDDWATLIYRIEDVKEFIEQI